MNNGNNSRTALSEAMRPVCKSMGLIGSALGGQSHHAQILLFSLPRQQRLSTDDIMEELKISRGKCAQQPARPVSWDSSVVSSARANGRIFRGARKMLENVLHHLFANAGGERCDRRRLF